MDVQGLTTTVEKVSSLVTSHESIDEICEGVLIVSQVSADVRKIATQCEAIEEVSSLF